MRLYRATKWDSDLYRSPRDVRADAWKKGNEASRPRFHILECLRWLGSDWGLLPKTGFEWEWVGVSAPKRTDREKCLLHYGGPDDMFLRRDTPLERPLFQVPVVVVQYMVLYYFSILARYYGLEWQRLLTATREPEGYVFRTALEDVAYDYLLNMLQLLPRLDDEPKLNLPSTLPPFAAKPPGIGAWYRNPVEVVPSSASAS